MNKKVLYAILLPISFLYGTDYFRTDLFWCTILRLLLIWYKLIILKWRFKKTFNKLIRLVIKKLK